MSRYFTAGLTLALMCSLSCGGIDKDSVLTQADIRFEEGDFQAAIRDYNRVLREDPDVPRAYNNRGVAHLRLGEAVAAIADFDAAIARQRVYAEAYYNRGLARFQSGDLDGSIADYSEALLQSPKYGKAWAGRGLARSKKGDLASAMADFKMALDASPADWPDRKAIEAELGKLEKARDGK